jgi:predicted TIM-barrel fold metal-dependent hydrolase
VLALRPAGADGDGLGGLDAGVQYQVSWKPGDKGGEVLLEWVLGDGNATGTGVVLWSTSEFERERERERERRGLS